MGITETANTTTNTANIVNLSLEFFQQIFKCVEPDVQIDAIEEEQASGRGDNYTATLYRTLLSGQRHINSNNAVENIPWEKHLICKRLPENVQRREAYKSDQLFRNEVQFYTTIMPELLKFQASKTQEEQQQFNALPQCYYARSDLLIMEDLRVRGFVMPDRKKGLTIDETELVLKQLAQFHALSLSYKFEKPKQFEKLRNATTEGLFCESNQNWYKNYYANLSQNAIKMLSDVFPDDSKYLIAMKNFTASSSFFAQMVKLVSTESTLSAICHGDCWANNFLYRYDLNETGDVKVLEVCLVDFQLIRYSSIAMDVANLLFCCTDKNKRDAHLADFIDLYTRENYSWLKKLSSSLPENCNTYEKFSQLFQIELKTFGRFALGLALDIIPISTCSPEDAPDLYIEHDDKEYGAPELNFPPNDLCRQKMSEILIDMVESDML